jgi:putative endonuclease
MNLSAKELGKLGEETAVQFLKEKGFQVKELNYHFGKGGEVDIIALDGDITVFIEVKTRQNLEMGDPVYGVTPAKVKQLKKVAGLYLYDKGIDEIDCRFDVITVLFGDGEAPVIEHYINAFD